MNSQKFKRELYPESFTEDDKLEFDILLEQSKLLFPKLLNDEWLLKMGIIAYINKKKKGDDDEPPTDEEIAKLRNEYTDDKIFYYTEPEKTEIVEAIEVKE